MVRATKAKQTCLRELRPHEIYVLPQQFLHELDTAGRIR